MVTQYKPHNYVSQIDNDTVGKTFPTLANRLKGSTQYCIATRQPPSINFFEQKQDFWKMMDSLL